jgi:hypothetical protein
VISINIDEASVYVKKIADDPTYKAAYGSSLSVALYHNEKKKTLNFKICKEVFLTIPMVMYTVKDFYLLEAMNEKIENLKSAGLVNFWLSQDIDEKISKVKAVIYPKVLTFVHLKGTFYILFIGFSVSFVVFVLELISLKSCCTNLIRF